jgi:outer membrane lipoprotein carrier protein
MKKSLALALTTLALLFGAHATSFAQPVDLAQVVQAMESPFRHTADTQTAINDFEADFFQESLIASLDRLQRGRGRVAIKFDRSRPDRAPLAMFRWQYEQPTSQEIVSDGRTMWVYLPENRQVIQSDMETAKDRPGDPMTFLTGLGNLSRDFQVSWATPNQDARGNFVLELRPRRPSPMIERMLVVVDGQALQSRTRRHFPILATTVYDPGGNSTLIEFSNIQVNRGLPPQHFHFTIPSGVEVVRPGGSDMGF